VRRIVTEELQVAGANAPVDTFFDKVVKYIPTDIVSAWVAVKGVVAATSVPSKNGVMWVCFGAFVVLTTLWTLKQTSVPGKSPAITQTVVATVAFVVWAVALGEPFTGLLGQETQSLYGSLLLIFFTLTVGLITPKES
jgi:hypothetical protein